MSVSVAALSKHKSGLKTIEEDKFWIDDEVAHVNSKTNVLQKGIKSFLANYGIVEEKAFHLHAKTGQIPKRLIVFFLINELQNMKYCKGIFNQLI